MKIGIFATCLADTLYPQVVEATARIITRLGHEPVVPMDQTCCGQMHINTGYQKESLPIVKHFVDDFSDPSIDAIVAPSGSCVGSVRHQHEIVAERFGDKALCDGVHTTRAKTFELSEFLVDVLGVTDIGAYFPHSVTYHPTCHSLRMLGVGDKPLSLLRAVEGLDLIELPGATECCGFGGTFAVKNADTSTAMLEDKIKNIESTGADYVSTSDSSCLLHITGGMHKLKTENKLTVDGAGIHLAQILASTHEHPFMPPVATTSITRGKAVSA